MRIPTGMTEETAHKLIERLASGPSAARVELEDLVESLQGPRSDARRLVGNFFSSNRDRLQVVGSTSRARWFWLTGGPA